MPVQSETGAATSRPHERPEGGGFSDRFSMHTKRLIWVWTFLALPVLFYSVIRFYPTLDAFRLSLTDWNLMKPPKFIGLENYRKMFADPAFWQVFKNTFAYLIFGTPRPARE